MTRAHPAHMPPAARCALRAARCLLPVLRCLGFEHCDLSDFTTRRAKATKHVAPELTSLRRWKSAPDGWQTSFDSKMDFTWSYDIATCSQCIQRERSTHIVRRPVLLCCVGDTTLCPIGAVNRLEERDVNLGHLRLLCA